MSTASEGNSLWRNASPTPGDSDVRVSVIIPVYGTAPFVPAALDSVLAQTYTRYEIVVVNDGSPDTPLLEELLRPYRGRIVYLSQQNRGSSAARNAGISAARGEYVAILDSDDYWHPEYLEAQMGVLETDHGIDVVYPDAFRFAPDGTMTKQFSKQHPVGGEITFGRVLARECEVYGGAAGRKESFVRAGLYDESLATGEDFDLWLRILRGGGRIVYNDRVLAYYRERPGSLTSDGGGLLRNMITLLDRLEAKLELTAEERRVVARQRANATASLALEEGKWALWSGNHQAAVAKLRQADKHRRSWKLKAVIFALTIAPALVVWVYRRRDAESAGRRDGEQARTAGGNP